MMVFDLFDIMLMAAFSTTIMLAGLLLSQRLTTETAINRYCHNNKLYPAKLIRRAGLPVKRSQFLYWSLKCFCTMCALLAVSELHGKIHNVLLIAMIMNAFFGCDLILWIRHRKRQQQITQSISLFLSLMIVYLRSGFSLAMAFQQSAQIGLEKGDPLGTELLLLARELRSGKDRADAFHDLADRTGVMALRRLSLIIDVGLKMGAPVIQTLITHQDTLKQDKWRTTTDKINRKSLEVMLPLAMISLPMFIILVFFPAAVQVISLLSLMAQSL